jgi:hypothetical protein
LISHCIRANSEFGLGTIGNAPHCHFFLRRWPMKSAALVLTALLLASGSVAAQPQGSGSPGGAGKASSPGDPHGNSEARGQNGLAATQNRTTGSNNAAESSAPQQGETRRGSAGVVTTGGTGADADKENNH